MELKFRDSLGLVQCITEPKSTGSELRSSLDINDHNDEANNKGSWKFFVDGNQVQKVDDSSVEEETGG